MQDDIAGSFERKILIPENINILNEKWGCCLKSPQDIVPQERNIHTEENSEGGDEMSVFE